MNVAIFAAMKAEMAGEKVVCDSFSSFIVLLNLTHSLARVSVFLPSSMERLRNIMSSKIARSRAASARHFFLHDTRRFAKPLEAKEFLAEIQNRIAMQGGSSTSASAAPAKPAAAPAKPATAPTKPAAAPTKAAAPKPSSPPPAQKRAAPSSPPKSAPASAPQQSSQSSSGAKKTDQESVTKRARSDGPNFAVGVLEGDNVAGVVTIARDNAELLVEATLDISGNGPFELAIEGERVGSVMPSGGLDKTLFATRIPSRDFLGKRLSLSNSSGSKVEAVLKEELDN